MRKIFLLALFCLLFFMSFFEFSVHAFDLEGIKIHGFMSQGYLKTDHNNYLADSEEGAFQFNEFGLNFTKRLDDKLTAGIQFFGRDMGTVGNDEIRIDWAYLDYRWRDWAGIRIGQTKMVYGLYNDTREIDMLRTSILLPQSVYIEAYRDTLSSCRGIDFYGSLPVRNLGRITYEFQYGAASLSPGDGVSQVLENYNRQNLNLRVENIDHDYSYAYEIAWETPFDGLRFQYSGLEGNDIKVSGSASANLPADLNHDGIISPGEGIPVTSFIAEYPLVRFNIFSGEWVYERFTIAAEYMEMDFRPVFFLGPVVDRRNLPYMGWYVAGSYRFNEFFTLGLSYSEFYPNSNDKNGDKQVTAGKKDFQGWQKTYTVSTRFNINEHWIIKLESSYNDGFGAMQPAYNDPSKIEPYWWLFAAKATVSF